jgi:two-component system, NarL family, sensor kinase
MPDNSRDILIVLIGSFVIFLVLAGVLIFVILYYQRKRNHHAKHLLEVEKMHTETLLISQIEIQEETFKTISQEIHDNIGQVLSLIKLNLNTLSPLDNSNDREKLNNSVILLTTTIKDLRDIAKSINTDFILQIGLANAIRQQLDLLSRAVKYEAVLEEKGIRKGLSKRNELIVYRVVQELLNNIIKHANATNIAIELYYGEESLILVVKDNGIGFDFEELSMADHTKKGIGLHNMQDRIRLINGSLEINSKVGKGTIIRIVLQY